MSELEQQKKTLSFEEICPEWSHTISQWENQNKEVIRSRMSDTKKCFVGEAHGGSPDYFFNPMLSRPNPCIVCTEFAQYGDKGLCAVIIDENWEKFERNKESFVKHFNEVHVK